MDSVFYKSSASMPEVGPETVDLVVTSPPYFCIKDYSRNGTQQTVHSKQHKDDYGAITDYRAYIRALLSSWRECYRVLKPNGKLIVNAPLMPMPKRMLSTHYNRDIFNIYADIENSILTGVPGMYLMDVYVWNRTNPSKRLMFGSYPYPRNLYAQNTIEFIGVFVKEGRPYPSDPIAKKSSTLTEREWIEYTKQVWDIPIPSRGDLAWGKHSAIMPEEIARRCIRMFSYVGDCVLDPFAGSGTTLKMAKDLARNYIGYEIYENYSEIIESKLNQIPGRRYTQSTNGRNNQLADPKVGWQVS